MDVTKKYEKVLRAIFPFNLALTLEHPVIKLDIISGKITSLRILMYNSPGYEISRMVVSCNRKGRKEKPEKNIVDDNIIILLILLILIININNIIDIIVINNIIFN